MFAIVTSQNSDNLIFYGPFNNMEAAERYAKKHHLLGCCTIVRLHDCAEALETMGTVHSRSKGHGN